MKKILPMTENVPMKSGNSTDYLCMLYGNGEINDEWPYSMYLQLRVGKNDGPDMFLNYDACINYLWPNVEMQTFYSRAIEECGIPFRQFIIDAIDHGYYVEPNVNYFYLQSMPTYHIYDFDHVIYFYGYDLDDETFHAYAYMPSTGHTSLKMKMDDVVQGIRNTTELRMGFLSKPWKYEFHMEIPDIVMKFKDYLNSVSNASFKDAWPYYCTENCFFGLEAMEAFRHELIKNKAQIDYINKRTVFIIAEHKQIVHSCLKYMKDHFDYPDLDGIIAAYQEIVDQTQIILKLALKFNLTKNQNVYDRVIERLEKVNLLEKEIIPQVIDILERKMITAQ